MRLLLITWFALMSLTNPIDGVYVHTNVDTLASIITAECSICSEEEKYLVGSTVLNRMDHPDYPTYMLDVITEPGQYLGYDSKWFMCTPSTCEVAENLLNGRNRDLDVLYFYSRDSPDTVFVSNMEPFVKHKMKYHLFATEADF